MDNTAMNPTINRPPDPPQSKKFDLSPLEFLLALFAVVLIPALIYTFFLFLKCPPYPFHRRQTSSTSSRASSGSEFTGTKKRSIREFCTDVKYKKEAHVKGVDGECPVCLSVFVDGEKVRQLNVCKHCFHASCIDTWLNSHYSCPVCRASIAVQMSDRATPVSAGEDDSRQGLPDSASLV